MKPTASKKKPFSAISLNTFLAWFFVETVHQNRLEFVLDAADSRKGETDRALLCRKGRVFTTYSDRLFEMLTAEFKRAVDTKIVLCSEYGSLSYQIEAANPAALQRALVRCDKVVQRWINKYRVNSMKEAA